MTNLTVLGLAADGYEQRAMTKTFRTKPRASAPNVRAAPEQTRRKTTGDTAGQPDLFQG